ncbi:hypothetical protein J1N35_013999 [Gossypium stocksii]|uniref:Uncharacterized protein n=1 Tax=Gossypium stocksii TaxID=47602 RepID=A0A9D3VUR9_9ROSI|nr:hypothetical protein J1N35_013999 [Gossypium stocksii]
MVKGKDDVIINLKKINEMIVGTIKKKDEMIAKIDVKLKVNEYELSYDKTILKNYERQSNDILAIGRSKPYWKKPTSLTNFVKSNEMVVTSSYETDFVAKVLVVPRATTPIIDKVAFDLTPFKQYDGSR